MYTLNKLVFKAKNERDALFGYYLSIQRRGYRLQATLKPCDCTSHFAEHEYCLGGNDPYRFGIDKNHSERGTIPLVQHHLK